MQSSHFRLLHLLRSRRLSPDKLPLSRLAPRPFRLFHPFPVVKRRRLTLPGAPQLFHFSLQALQLLLQSLVQGLRLRQLCLQLSITLIFWVRESFVVPFSHRHQFKVPTTFSQESFGLFNLPFDLSFWSTLDAKQVLISMHSTEAVIVKLVQPTKHKAEWLENTIKSFSQAVQYGLDAAQEHKTSSRAKLHKVVYRPAREQFGLPSDYARMAVNASVSLARSFYGLRKSGQRATFPKVSGSQGIGLGVNAYTMIRNDNRFVLRVSTGKRDQYIWLPLQVPTHYRETIQLTYGDAKLFQRNGDWYVMLPVRITHTPAARGGEPTFIGVDLGIVRHATIATPDRLIFFDGKAARNRREHFADVRRRYQRHRRIDRVKDQRGKERRWMADLNHKLSRQIGNIAAQYQNQVIVLERLDGIRYRTRGSKRFNRMVASWTFRDLVSKIQYKAARLDIPVVFVDPRNTSKTCFRCGHATRSNRPNQATFRCVKCGYRQNADANAAQNIAAQGPIAFGQGRPDTARSQDQTENELTLFVSRSRPDGGKECASAHSDSNLASPPCGTPRL